MTITDLILFDPLVFCSAELIEGLQNHLLCLSVFNIAIAISTIVGNTLILIALCKATSLHPPSRVLLSSLAASDLCIGFMEPLYVTYLLSLTHERSQICRHIVPVRSIAITVSFAVSLLTTTAISVDRLLALLLGLRYRQVVTLQRVYAVVIAIWVYPSVGFSLWFYSHFIWKLFAASNIILCLIIAIYCYSRIFRRLRRHRTQVRGNVQEQASQTIPLNITRYRKSVFMAMWVQLVLVLCYLPYTFVAPFAFQNIQRNVERSSASFLALQTTVTLIFLNSSLNPILYFCKIKEMRRAVKDTLRQLCCS